MKKIKILIVENEVIISLNMRQQLLNNNLDVLKPVRTGEKAVSVSMEEKPDVILMDIELGPKMDGLEAARKIMSVYSPYFIFITGYFDQHIKDEIESLNSPLVHKPYYIKEILQHIIYFNEQNPSFSF